MAMAAEPVVAPPSTSAAASSPPPPGAPSPSSQESEDDQAAILSLAPGTGFLYVVSPLATNVYIYGLLAGTTNQRIATKCGPRFIRLGTKLGSWQGEGEAHVVKCGALTRVEMAPR